MSKKLTWEFVRNLGALRFSKASFIFLTIIPILLKATEKFVNPFVLYLNEKEYIFQLELPFNWFYLYFGAISISLGSLIFILFCPKIIKEFKDYGAYMITGKPDDYLLNYLKTFPEIEKTWHKYKPEIIKGIKLEKSPYTRIEEIEENINHTINMEYPDGSKKTFFKKEKVFKGYTKNLKYYEDRRKLFNLIYESATRRFKLAIIFSQFFYYFGFLLIGVIFIQNLIYIVNYLFG